MQSPRDARAISCALFSLAVLSALSLFPPSVMAEDATIEEVIVTGSHIQRSKMDAANPVETLTAAEVQGSGYTQIGQYIRDLTYTANIDTVANVLATRGGIQDSNRTSFNLRGLGESSTLTLFDGRRTLNSGSVSDIMPDIALQRVDIVLDGGAATYGTDAVAGVVNLVPISSFDGYKLRGFYDQDQHRDTNEYKLAGLWGKTTDAADLVVAVEWSERPNALRNYERPKYLAADNDTSISGLLPNGYLSDGVPPTGGARVVDPDCGTFNGNNTDDSKKEAYPSGLPLFANTYCSTEYGRWHDTARSQTALNIFGGLTAHLTDYIDLKLQYVKARQKIDFNTSGTTAERGSNLTYVIPGGPTPIGRDGGPAPAGAHPNNPFDGNLRPRDWRPFAINGTTPSYIDSVGSQTPVYTYDFTSYALGTEFEIGDSGWIGELWYSNQRWVNNIDGYELSRERLGLALEGLGGPTGDQWINPFGSRDPRSANFCDAPVGQPGPGGCIGTNNTQEMVDWVNVKRDYHAIDSEYQSVEGFVTGDIFELPAGGVGLAIGGQYRWYRYTTTASQAARVGDSYGTSILTPPDPGASSEQDIYAVFGELLVPVLDNLEVTVAVRYEDFADFGFSETVPKFSALFTPTQWLALRGSWGKGFLAPTLEELTVLTVPSCAEQFGGADPIVGTLNTDGTWAGAPLAGAQSCTNGSEDLLPEKSKIFNLGFTVQPLDGLELSLDYQEIEYTDQIRQLSLIDTVEQDYNNFLIANGLSSDSYRSLPVDQRDALARAWAANPDRVLRNPNTALIEAVNRSSVNVAEVDVGVLDLRADLGFAIGDYGFLNLNWATTHYTKYDYIDSTGEKTDALGKRNDDTDIVPPMPKFKHMARVAWTYNRHLVALVAKGYSSVDFDGTVGPAFGPGLGAEVPDKIKSQWVVNLRYGYTFENLFGGAGILDVAVGANNVFDKRAQALPVQGGLESRLQDPFGRMLYLEATWSVE